MMFTFVHCDSFSDSSLLNFPLYIGLGREIGKKEYVLFWWLRRASRSILGKYDTSSKDCKCRFERQT